MKTYTFYLYDGTDAVPAFEIELFETREDALDFARHLLAERRRYDQLVVTEETEEIARIDRREPRTPPREDRLGAEG